MHQSGKPAVSLELKFLTPRWLNPEFLNHETYEKGRGAAETIGIQCERGGGGEEGNRCQEGAEDRCQAGLGYLEKQAQDVQVLGF